MDAQADLNLHCGHMPFCWFCHAADIFQHILASISQLQSQKEELKATVIRNYKMTAEKEHARILMRRQTIENRKEELEHLNDQRVRFYYCVIDYFLCLLMTKCWCFKLNSILEVSCICAPVLLDLLNSLQEKPYDSWQDPCALSFSPTCVINKLKREDLIH